LANQLDTDYEVVEALPVYDCGVLEGRSDEAAWQLWQELADAWLEDKQWERRIEGGENSYEVQSRFVGFIDNLVREYKDTEANLVCVGHDGLYWMALRLVLNNVDTELISERGGFGYATLIVSEWRPGPLVCREWNGVGINTHAQG
jgi:broad specificity phosphatase PhoE